MRALALLLLLLPATARAEFALPQLLGDWSGSGNYARGEASGMLRCRLAITPEGQFRVEVSGRCASAEGATAVAFVLIPQADGTIMTESRLDTPPDTRIEALRGLPEADRLVLDGSAAGETVELSLWLLENGNLGFASRHLRYGREDRMQVELSPR
jgi:hypothetical protein